MRYSELKAALLGCSLVLIAGCETEFKMKADGAPPMSSGPAAAGTPSALPTGGSSDVGSGTGGAAAVGGTGAMSAVSTAGSGGEPASAGTGGAMGEPAASGTGGSMMSDAPQTCPATSTLKPGETTETIMVGAATRRYILHVPASYTGKTPVPLVLDFHGILMNSTLQRAFSGYAALSDSQGFIVAYPEGTDTAFNVGICCTSSLAVDDIGFARAIVDRLKQQGCIDNKRVHSVGYSMGGGMSMHLACNATDLFASIAISAFDLMPEEDWPCKPSRPIAIAAFRSTGDPIVPYAGAKDTIPPNGTSALVTFIGAEANFTKWGSLDGCTGSPETLTGGCKSYTKCAAGVAVTLCTKQGGGHDYMDAAAGWAFLKQHPMP